MANDTISIETVEGTIERVSKHTPTGKRPCCLTVRNAKGRVTCQLVGNLGHRVWREAAEGEKVVIQVLHGIHLRRGQDTPLLLTIDLLGMGYSLKPDKLGRIVRRALPKEKGSGRKRQVKRLQTGKTPALQRAIETPN